MEGRDGCLDAGDEPLLPEVHLQPHRRPALLHLARDMHLSPHSTDRERLTLL
jgi:hypothetical protein